MNARHFDVSPPGRAHPHYCGGAGRRRRLCVDLAIIAMITGIGAIAASPAFAQTTTLGYSQIKWQDRGGTFHPLANGRLDLWDDDTNWDAIVSADDGPAGPFFTSAAGAATMTTTEIDAIPFDDLLELYTQVYAEASGIGKVVNQFGGFTRNFRHPSGNGVFLVNEGDSFTGINTDFDRGSDARKAVALLQEVRFIHNYFDNVLAGLTIPADVEIQFQATTLTGAPGTFQTGTKQLSVTHPTTNIGQPNESPNNAVDSDWGDIDVIFHEFAHLVASNNSLDITPGLSFNHAPGFDSIGVTDQVPNPAPPPATIPHVITNAEGTQLAWQEGIATFLGLMAIKNGNLNAAIPGLPATDRDEFYDDYVWDNATNNVTATSLRYGLESYSVARSPKGEGDEHSVSQILWDLFDADDTNAEPQAFRDPGHNDRWGLGAQTVVNLMKADGGANDGRLIDLWGDVQTAHATAPKRAAELGELFEEYGVSAMAGFADGGAIGDGAMTIDTTPLLAWRQQNSNHSSMFQVAIFDDAFTQLVLQSPALGNVTNWTVPNANALPNGDYNWVVLSNSVMQGALNFNYNAGNNTVASQSYWSGAAQFSVVPEPSSVLLAVIGLLSLFVARRSHARRYGSSSRAGSPEAL